MGRIGLLVAAADRLLRDLPALPWPAALRPAVLEHGIETGIIKRLPHGEFIEVHQPLADRPAGLPGRPRAEEDEPARPGGAPVAGSFLTPDPPQETAALARAQAR